MVSNKRTDRAEPGYVSGKAGPQQRMTGPAGAVAIDHRRALAGVAARRAQTEVHQQGFAVNSGSGPYTRTI